MKAPRFVLVSLVWLLLVGCAGTIDTPTAIAVTPVPTQPPTTTLADVEAATAQPSPSITVSPITPSATPDLSWITQALPADSSYRIPLTLRHLTEHVAVFQYALEAAAPAQLLVWREADHGLLDPIELSEAVGLILVEDLTPGVSYQAAILVGEATPGRPTMMGGVWPTVHFRTLDYEREPLKVAVLGDSGFADQATLAISQQIATEAVDFVLHTGDIVYRVDQNPDPAAAYQLKLYQAHQPILANAPFYPVAGNHEYDGPTRWQGKPYFFEAFPKLTAPAVDYPTKSDGSWYSVSHDNIQFLMLNTQSIFGEGSEVDQRAWLAERVADPDFRYSVVVMHVPPYNLGRHQGSADIVRARWGDLIINDRVPLVLAGHDHNYQRWQLDSTTVVVTGGGSAVLYDLSGGDPRFQRGASVSHHVYLEFGDRSIKLKAIDRQGATIDEAEFSTPQ